MYFHLVKIYLAIILRRNRFITTNMYLTDLPDKILFLEYNK